MNGISNLSLPLRSLSFLTDSYVVFLLPEQNGALSPPLQAVLGSLVGSVQDRVHVAYLEKVLTFIKNDRTVNPELTGVS
jgi:hypothetical protein